MSTAKRAVLATVCVAATLGAEARGKFIAHGWDTMKATPSVVLTNTAQFAKAGFDGITLTLPTRKQADGSTVEPWNLPTDAPWRYETYADQVSILKEITAKPGLKESFLMCAFSPMRGRLAWTDDAAWAKFVGNMRVFARLAKAGGVRGLFLDNEDYCSRQQFALKPGDGDFDTAYRLARQRGREVLGGVFREFPEAVILPFWLLTQVESLIQSVDPVVAMRNTGALWPAFVNGIFDVLPPTGRIVDGNEYAYTYEWNKGQFASSAADQLIGFLPLIEPENRAKYRAQLSVGFGLYIDMYVQENPKATWYFGPVNGSRLEHFRLNLTEAAKRADEYVWVYGEQVSFVKWNGIDTKDIRFKPDVTWEDLLPGLSQTVRDVKNPGAGMMDRVAAARAKGVNFFPVALKRESHWQNPKCKQGTYAVDPKAGVGGTITLMAIVNGCSNLPIDAKPGETYVFDMWMTGSCGDGQKPSMCFMDEKGKYRWDLGTVHSSLVEKDSVGRSRFCAIARVPEKMAGINLMLNGGQHNGETGSFTDIFISKCEESE